MASDKHFGPRLPVLFDFTAAIFVYAFLQIILFVLWIKAPETKARTSVAEPTVAVIEAVVIAVLSYFEHVKSTRPSVLLNGYLALTIILDIALSRTFWIRDGANAIAGVFTTSSLLFWWLNGLFYRGAKHLLAIDDLDNINHKLSSGSLHDRLSARWESHSKESSLALLSCTYKWQFAAGVIPRLFYAGFNFAQSFLIREVITFIGISDGEWSNQVASGLIGATVLIFVGRAIAGLWYRHTVNQMVTMYRASLVSLIYQKTLELQTTSIKENAPVTLMSTDVEQLLGVTGLHEIWACFIELPVGIYILYRQVGLPSLFILIPTIVTTLLSGALAPAMEPAQMAWNAAVQERIGQASGSVSWDVTPLIVILAAIYWTKAGEGLSITEAFTSLSIISLATQPIIMIIVSLTQAAGICGSFIRIQTFLMLNKHADPRSPVAPETKRQKDNPPAKALFLGSLEMEDIVDNDNSRLQATGSAVKITDASFKIGEGTTLLRDISIEVQRETVSMIISRVGGGKSSLLKAMVGELAPDRGEVRSAWKSCAYCDQAPWLQNISTKDNMVGQTPLDEVWLSTVISACALDRDLSFLPKGEDTLVGSGGIALSGGQKQRIALARAVYSRKNLVILDDVFSGLDNKTSRTVFKRLLAPDGLLRKSKATVVLSTSNPDLLAAADHITMLEGHIARNQVPYDSLKPSDWGALTNGPEAPEADEKKDEAVKRIGQLASATKDILQEHDLTRQTGDWECCMIYFRSLSWRFAGLSFVMIAAAVGLEIMPKVWLKLWTEKGAAPQDAGYTAGYVAFAVAAVLIGVTSLGAPLYFFTTTESGTILNRFSQDMTLIDQVLPFAAYMTAMRIIASGANYVAAVIPFIAMALFFFQRYYLRTSRQMRFLDLEMKAPLYTHFTETVSGVATIRAFGWARPFQEANTRKLDVSQKPYYLMMCLQLWLQLVLDMFVAGLAVVLVAVALKVRNSTSQGAIALAMVNLLDFGETLTILIGQWTELETSLGAIARLKLFVQETPSEDKNEEVGGTSNGVDLSTLPRRLIRSHLATVPQDPIEITGSVRANLDPETQIQCDETLVSALHKTNIWPLVEARGGLNADMAEIRLSTGQKQLFCLARCLLSRSKVLLLDEPTGSVDREERHGY
ncbi:uncharacterized protein J7T54_007008 [Emericellopsis cladophorae]|uniref:ABC transporter n=1 Tax=Emericellopsis cladophorae TaxID=2686198 RepID=A0A9P9Y8D9_9HYPO|nr:uncharacterized protein J7T54_007008 [Emericellopsis cladophorae]KAI6785366.1 hypothetical protein J7T54_007008 [Emericellopsis cladophorae]